MQDNFMLISVNGEHSNLLECRRKTELIGVLLKHNPSVRIQFSDTYCHHLETFNERGTVE
jgi:hypothetical protein